LRRHLFFLLFFATACGTWSFLAGFTSAEARDSALQALKAQHTESLRRLVSVRETCMSGSAVDWLPCMVASHPNADPVGAHRGTCSRLVGGAVAQAGSVQLVRPSVAEHARPALRRDCRHRSSVLRRLAEAGRRRWHG